MLKRTEFDDISICDPFQENYFSFQNLFQTQYYNMMFNIYINGDRKE